jgi:prolipoprotein diacylglyceryltransferase
MLWNFGAAGLLLWMSRRYEKQLKPGSLFAGWLVLAGVGQVWIGSFRLDQSLLPGTGLSYTRLVAIGMAIAGAAVLLIKYKVIRLPFLSSGPDTYSIQPETNAEHGEEQETVVSDVDEPQMSA